MRIPTPVPVEALSEQPAGSLTFTKTARTLARARPPGSSSAPNATCFWSPVRSVRLRERLGNNSGAVEVLFRALRSGDVRRALLAEVRPDAPVAGRARRLGEREVQELVAAYRAGASIAAIARQFHLAQGTVSARLLAAGVPMRNDVQPHEREQMAKLAEEGHSLNTIGRLVGRDPKTVKTVLTGGYRC